jgi:hypothetical protein
MDYSRRRPVYTTALFEITFIADLSAESRRTSTRNGTLATTILWEQGETLARFCHLHYETSCISQLVVLRGRMAQPSRVPHSFLELE